MKITIEADAKELAALVAELQKRREGSCELELEFDKDKAIESALAAIRDMREADADSALENAKEFDP